MKNYKIDNKYWNLLSIDSLKLILAESSTLLLETQESIKSIANKSNDLLKIIIVALFAIIGFVFGHEVLNLFLLISSMYFICTLVIAIFIVYGAISPKSTALCGVEPATILQDDVINTSKTQSEKMIYFIRIQSIQAAIDNNKLNHLKALNKYKNGIIFILVSIFIYVILFLLNLLLLFPSLGK